MAKLAGTIIPASVVPMTTEDTYPTHFAQYGKGGWKEVATVTERDAIPTDRRESGMAVYVTGTNKLYILDSNLTTWTEFAGGSSGSVTWGSITGTLSNQTDLRNALSIKATDKGIEQGIENTIAFGSDDNLAGHSTVMGIDSAGYNEYSTVYGCEAISEADSTVAIGDSTFVSATYGTALGSEAQVSGNESIQIGSGNNEEDYTFSVGFASYENYKLLDGTTGVIPHERLSTTTPDSDQVLYFDGTGLDWKTIDIPSYTPGTGISITNNVISVDTTAIQSKLTPSTGISISNNTISVDTTAIQAKLTQSTGITITNNTISATAATASTRGAVKLTSVSNSTLTDGTFTCNYITTTLGLNAPISSVLVDKFKNDQAVKAEIAGLANIEMNSKFKVANTLPTTLASGTWLALLEE